jgi:predicted ferric reductase
MEELHEFTGILGLFGLVVAALSGLLVYRFKYVNRWLHYDAVFLIHRLATLLVVAAITVHFFTTDERHPVLLAGLIAIATVMLLGTWLHMRKSKTVIYLKMGLLSAAAVLLLIGHEIAEEHEHNGTGHSEYHDDDHDDH